MWDRAFAKPVRGLIPCGQNLQSGCFSTPRHLRDMVFVREIVRRGLFAPFRTGEVRRTARARLVERSERPLRSAIQKNATTLRKTYPIQNRKLTARYDHFRIFIPSIFLWFRNAIFLTNQGCLPFLYQEEINKTQSSRCSDMTAFQYIAPLHSQQTTDGISFPRPNQFLDVPGFCPIDLAKELNETRTQPYFYALRPDFA